MTASRTPRVCLAGLALALAAAAAPAQSRAPLALTGVTVVDTVSGQRVPARTIYIDNGVIERVVPDEPPPAGVRTVDGRGTFVIPGLWDMHAHHEASGELSLPLYVANGVTGTRDMGSDLEFILRLRARHLGRSPWTGDRAGGPDPR